MLKFNYFKLSRYAVNTNIVQLKLLGLCWGKEVITEFERVLDEIEKTQENIQVLIITGNKHFCTGADLSDPFIKTKEGGKWMNEKMTTNLNRFCLLPIISYAAIDTLAVGGGAEFASSTDFRVMKHNAYIQFVHSRFGIVPGWGAYTKLVNIVGLQVAKSILYDAEKLDAEYCKSIYLADHVVENPELYLVEKYSKTKDLNLVPFESAAPNVEKGYIKGLKSLQYHNRDEQLVFQELWMSPYHELKISPYNKKIKKQES